jgi:hypothetical protein
MFTPENQLTDKVWAGWSKNTAPPYEIYFWTEDSQGGTVYLSVKEAEEVADFIYLSKDEAVSFLKSRDKKK